MSDFDKSKWLEQTSAYMEYIATHKQNVILAWEELKKAVSGIKLFQSQSILIQMENRVYCHDDSKFTEEEFLPYRQHFYPVEGEAIDPDEFEKAWKLHYSRNPHHWQHWVDENGKFYPSYAVEEKICAYLEMICDWQAMSYVKGGSAAKYYNENKEKIKIDPNWLPFVEEVLDCLETYITYKAVVVDG